MMRSGFAVAGGPARAQVQAPPPLVLIAVGTRPEAIKVASLVRAFEARGDVAVCVVNSGQHPAAVNATLAEFGLRADLELAPLPVLPNLRASFAHLSEELKEAIRKVRPDVVVVQGDTLTAWAAAAAARECDRPIAHVEAGLRTNRATDPFPEEWFRRQIARIATWHFAPTRVAARNLLDEGIAPESVFVTGNTGIDSLKTALATLGADELSGDDGIDRVLVTLHRRENHDRNADIVCRALIRLAELRPRVRVTFPVHPNPRVAVPIRRRLGAHPSFDLVAPMAYREFLAAAARSALIISDSGGIQEEAAHLGTRLLVPRTNTERPEAIDTGFVRLIDVRAGTLVDEACAALDAPRLGPLPIDAHAPFGAGDAGEQIARTLARIVARTHEFA